MIGIYVFTNKKTGQQYVGQSVQIEKRYAAHIKGRESYIDLAIQQEGITNFSFEVLEECTKAMLDDRERYWIKHLKSLFPNGYNLTPGGQHNPDSNFSIESLTPEDVKRIQNFYADGTYQSGAAIQRDWFPNHDRHLIAKIFNGSLGSELNPAIYNQNYYYKGADQTNGGRVMSVVDDVTAIILRCLYSIHTREEIFQYYPEINQRTIVSILSGQSRRFLPLFKKQQHRWLFPTDWDDEQIENFKQNIQQYIDKGEKHNAL